MNHPQKPTKYQQLSQNLKNLKKRMAGKGSGPVEMLTKEDPRLKLRTYLISLNLKGGGSRTSNKEPTALKYSAGKLVPKLIRGEGINMDPKTIDQRLLSIEIMLATILDKLSATPRDNSTAKEFIAAHKATGKSMVEIINLFNAREKP